MATKRTPFKRIRAVIKRVAKKARTAAKRKTAARTKTIRPGPKKR